MVEGTYQEGLKDGKWIWDIPLVGTKEGTYKEGKKEGKWVVYDFDGNKTKQKIYDHGELIKEVDCRQNPEECAER